MSIREQIMQIAQSDPQFAQAVDAMERAVINMPIVPEDLDEAIETLETIILNPSEYGRIREKAIAEDMVDEDMLPQQYNQVYIVSLLVALYGLQDRLSQKGYARGGLSVAARQLAARGRNGDTELAHITRGEAEMLRRAGGSGTINPETGLREYFKLKKIKWGKVLAAVAPIALNLIVPGIGGIVGSALTGGLLASSGTAAGLLGGAAIGAAASAAGGQNPLTGAITGGIGAGVGSVLGGGVNTALGLGLSEGAANVLGGGLAGAGAAALQGRDPLTGAVAGTIGSGIGELGGLGIENPDISRGVAAATRGFGNALTGGATPSEALVTGGLSGLGGLAAGLMPASAETSGQSRTSAAQPGATSAPAAATTATAAPTDVAVTPAPIDVGAATGPLTQVANNPALDVTAPSYTGAEASPGLTLGSPLDITAPNYAGAEASPGVTGNAAFGNPLDVFAPNYRGAEASPGNTSAQQAAAPTNLTANPNATDTYGEGLGPATTGTTRASSGGTLRQLAPLLAGGAALAAISNSGSNAPPQAQQAVRSLPASQQAYLNRPGITWDWNRLSADAASSNLTLDQFLARNWNRVTGGEYNIVRAMAQGGLNAMSRFVKGGGTGRSDEINAKLSDGEYVIDAETVAMLGDGSSKAGAKRLDEMRASIRKHKGKVLARGKFSPNAKSPLSYLKEVS